MRAICIDEEVTDLGLTVGKEYKILGGNLGAYLVKTDDNRIISTFARRFKLAKGCRLIGGTETTLRGAYKLPYVNYLVEQERMVLKGEYDYMEYSKSHEDWLRNNSRLERLYVNCTEEGIIIEKSVLSVLYEVDCTELLSAIEASIIYLKIKGKYSSTSLADTVQDLSFTNALHDYRLNKSKKTKDKIIEMLI